MIHERLIVNYLEEGGVV